MKLIKRLLSSWIGRIIIVMTMMPGFAFLYLKLSGHLNPGPVSAMHSPGAELGGYASHADFEQECKHCHAPIHCITASRCQTCHLDVAKERATAEGLHALMPGTDRCQTCHKEHQGREAVITEVPLTNIDHAKLTGFSLVTHGVDGEGKPVVCEDCHRDGVLAAEGLDCVTCHLSNDKALAQAHIDRYGSDCVLCHNGTDGTLAFDHQRIFVLEDGHAEAQCEDCHADRAFEGMASDCAGCHAEPAYHQGQFGNDCARCHTAIAWSPAGLKQHTFQIDHGDDADVACATCHTGTYTEHTCYGCHNHEPAAVLAQHQVAGLDELTGCADCHKTGLEDEVEGLRAAVAAHVIPASESTVPVGTEEP